MTSKTGLDYLAVEVSYGTRWVNINNGETYKIAGDTTRESTAKTWRKVTADSPILGGNYLVHAVPEMVAEQVGVYSAYTSLWAAYKMVCAKFQVEPKPEDFYVWVHKLVPSITRMVWN